MVVVLALRTGAGRRLGAPAQHVPSLGGQRLLSLLFGILLIVALVVSLVIYGYYFYIVWRGP